MPDAWETKRAEWEGALQSECNRVQLRSDRQGVQWQFGHEATGLRAERSGQVSHPWTAVA